MTWVMPTEAVMNRIKNEGLYFCQLVFWGRFLGGTRGGLSWLSWTQGRLQHFDLISFPLWFCSGHPQLLPAGHWQQSLHIYREWTMGMLEREEQVWKFPSESCSCYLEPSLSCLFCFFQNYMQHFLTAGQLHCFTLGKKTKYVQSPSLMLYVK